MTAEQPRIDADTLGRVAYEALAEQMVRDGIPEDAISSWEELGEVDQIEYRAMGQAVARVVLSAALAHLRADLEWTRGRTRGETVRHVLDGYEDAIDELATYAKQAGLGAPE